MGCNKYMDERTPLLDSLPEVLQRLAQRSKDLERGLKALGSNRDTNSYRAGLNRTLNESTELAKSAARLLPRYQGVNREKLALLYTREVSRLETLGKQLSEKESQFIARHSQEEESKAQGALLTARLEYLEPDLESVEDHREALRAIEQNVQQLGDMMKDMAVLVEDQQEGIDRLDHNIQSTTSSVQEGAQEIGVAAKHQKRSRKWMCWVLVILCVTALVLVLVFVLPKSNR
jgi:syntaxin 1B/2/3